MPLHLLDFVHQGVSLLLVDFHSDPLDQRLKSKAIGWWNEQVRPLWLPEVQGWLGGGLESFPETCMLPGHWDRIRTNQIELASSPPDVGELCSPEEGIQMIWSLKFFCLGSVNKLGFACLVRRGSMVEQRSSGDLW